MDERALAFLKKLLDAPGPSGFEQIPARIWRDEAKAFAQVEVDVHGNSLATLNAGGSPKIMLAGHVDEIGLMIVHVDDDGYLHFAGIGGWDSQVLVGQRVLIQGKDGGVLGVIGKKAIHLMKPDDRDRVSKITDLWIDIGARNKDEALKRISIGDPAVLAAHPLEFPNGRVISRSIDNRIGAFVVLEALRALAAKTGFSAQVTAVATTQEEIAYTGGGARTSAVKLQPDAAIVVDVTHATDYPGVEKKEIGDFKLGAGPVISRGSVVNRMVFGQLIEAAEAAQIAYAVEAAPRATNTDADAIHTARSGVATGLVSVPCRYMHSPNEMVSLDDLERAAQLLAAWVAGLKKDTSFIPM
jgi:putative aminopeptidase FrvX